MTHRFWLCLSSPLLLALAGACSGPSQTAKRTTSPDEGQEIAVVRNASNAVPPEPGDELICEFEETVGSHIPKRICRAKSDVETTRTETQNTIRNMRPAPPPNGK